MNDLRAKNKKTLVVAVAVIVGMIALSYAFVPLYKKFCQMTGLDGTVTRADQLPDTISKREISVLFDARVDSSLPWEFRPEKRKVTVKIGQQGVIAYRADNLTAQRTVGTAVYNVTPQKAAKYFHKTQCFCFAEQLLNGGEMAQFPVMFFFDPELLDDPEMDDVTDITLSYTFYAADSKNLDRALAHYGQKPDQTNK